jgi:POT family proton-dependent oligopeptide transporter
LTPDQYLGRLKTIVYSSVVYMVGLVILLASSLPWVDCRVSLSGLIAAMITIGFGTRGIRPNVNSLVAEQYTATKGSVRTLKSGERVIVDPKLTVQR